MAITWLIYKHFHRYMLILLLKLLYVFIYYFPWNQVLVIEQEINKYIIKVSKHHWTISLHSENKSNSIWITYKFINHFWNMINTKTNNICCISRTSAHKPSLLVENSMLSNINIFIKIFYICFFTNFGKLFLEKHH